MLSSPADTNSPVGTYPIIPGGLSSTNYALSYSNGTLTVSAYALSVTADNQGRAYGQANPTLTGSVVGLQDGDNITAVYGTAADTNSPVGVYPITIGLLDPENKLGNYSVTTNNGTLTVSAAGLTVSADNQSQTYGGAAPALTGSVVGLANGDNITAVYTTVVTPGSPVGVYPITIGLLDPADKLGNYSVTTNNGTLTVNAAALTVAANNASRPYGGSDPVFGGTISGLQNGDNITAAYSCSATSNSPVGTYAIMPSLVDPGNRLGNYQTSVVNGTLTVFAPPVIQTVGQSGSSFTFTWSATSAQLYQIQTKTNLNQPDWTNLGSAFTATNSTMTTSESIVTNAQQFYRVVLLP